MANLTFRSVKGSPLTNAELDSNFEYFTGSHAITGSLTTTEGIVTSGSILISGSIIPNVAAGASTSSFSLGSPTAAWKDIYVSDGTINFLDASGNIVSTIGTGNNQFTGDTFINGRLSQGNSVTASGLFSHAEGTGSQANGLGSHAEGFNTVAGTGFSGINANHAEGRQTTASGRYSHAEGYLSYTVGEASHAEGYNTFTNGSAPGSHAEGYSTRTDGAYAHSEGTGSMAWSNFSHAEGINTYTYDPTAQTVTTGQPALGSHAEGEETITIGRASHAEGYQSYASGSWSHAEGYQSYTEGIASHAEGLGTVAMADYQHVSGKYNAFSSNPNDLFIIGNGTSGINRKNILTVNTSSIIASGSILVSGSIIPNVAVGASTSSFSLGSPTAAWKDIYVSNGTINFLNGAGQIQGTIGAGTNATVITGSLVTVPLNPLTDFAFSSTTIRKSYTNSDCVFSLANSSTQYSKNPEIYTNGSIMVLPWDRKITAYSLVNNCLVAAPLSPTPIVSLPPVYNAGYTSGDIITVYNMGETGSFYKASGSIYITATVSGVTQVDTNNKLITGVFNTSYIISGSWGNYTNLSSFIPATTQSIKVDPGQKATFEVVYWGSSTPGSTPNVLEFPEIGYKTNMTNVSPSFTYLVYKFKGIENL